MKNLLLLTLVFSLVFISACKKDPTAKLVGDWQLDSVSGEDLSTAEKATVISFEKENKYQIKREDEVMEKGSFSLSEDGASITLKPEEGEEEKMEKVEVKDGKMTFTSDKGDEVVLKKK